MVVKNPDAYKGKLFVIYGQIHSSSTPPREPTRCLADTASRNTMSYGFFDGENSMLAGTGSAPVRTSLEDDVFRATVEVTGSFSYDTQIGGNTTVPLLKVVRIKRVS